MEYIRLIAQKVDPGKVNVPVIDPTKVALGALNIAYYVTGAVAVLVIVIAGFMFVTANGDTGQITKSKNAILYAVIGLVVIISAFAITNFVTGRF